MTLPTSRAFHVFFYLGNFMTVISCNVKHYCPVLPSGLHHYSRTPKAAGWHVELAGCLHVIKLCYLCYWSLLVHITSLTEAQNSLRGVEAEREKGSAAGRHHQLVVLVCDFTMFKAQRSFFLISESQYAENRSHKVLVYCVTLLHLHFSIIHSRLAWKVTHSAGCLGKMDCFHLQGGLQQSTFKMTL